LDIAQRIGDRGLESTMLGNLGLVYAELGEPGEAIKVLEPALKIAREIGDRQGEGARLSQLGVAYQVLDKMDKALDCCEQALVIAREIGDQGTEAFVNSTLGLIYQQQGDPSRAVVVLQSVVNYHRRIGHVDTEKNSAVFEELKLINEAEALIQSGGQHFKSNRPDSAIGFYKQALRIYRELDHQNGEGVALACISDVYMSLGKAHHAAKYLEQSLAIARHIGNRGLEAITNWNLAMIRQQQGELTQDDIAIMQTSVDYMREVGHRRAKEFAETLAETLKNVGEDCLKSNQLHQAVEVFKRALSNYREIGNQQGEMMVLTNLGKTYMEMGQSHLAIGCIKQATIFAHKLGEYDIEAVMSWVLGVICEGEGDFANAIDAMQISVDYYRRTGQLEAAAKRAAHVDSLRNRLGEKHS